MIIPRKKLFIAKSPPIMTRRHLIRGGVAIVASWGLYNEILGGKAEALVRGGLTTNILSGYNNIANLPSLGFNSDTPNRPLVTGSGAGTLTCIGPTGGGVSTTNDPVQVVPLTSSGPITTTAPGQTITGHNISTTSDAINVNHNNTHIIYNKLTVSGFPGCAVSISTGVTGTVIEDNVIDGGTVNGANYTISNDSTQLVCESFTARRNNVSGAEKLIGSQCQLNNLIIDNYMWAISGADADASDVWPTDVSCANTTFQHNYYDGANGGDQFDTGVNIGNYDGGNSSNRSISNILVTLNAFRLPNCTHCVIVQGNYVGGSTGGVTGIQLTFNGFVGGISQTPSEITSGVTVSANANNYNMATPTSASGTLLNGTGVM